MNPKNRRPPSLDVLPAYGMKKQENIEMLKVFWRSVPVLKQGAS
jgi:hypothetical protein